MYIVFEYRDYQINFIDEINGSQCFAIQIFLAQDKIQSQWVSVPYALKD